MKKLAAKMDFSVIPESVRPVTLDQKIRVLRDVARSHAARMSNQKVGWKRKNLKTNYFIWLENVRLWNTFKYY